MGAPSRYMWLQKNEMAEVIGEAFPRWASKESRAPPEQGFMML